MPYISREARKKLDPHINALITELDNNAWQVGEMNYVFSRIVNKLFDLYPSYDNINAVTGTLENVNQEFYRRRAVPYEEKKIKTNGDI